MMANARETETYVNMNSWQVLLYSSRSVGFRVFVTFGVLTATAAVATATTSTAAITRTSAAKLRKFHRLSPKGGRQRHSLGVCKEFFEHGRLYVEPSATALVNHM